MSLTHDDTIFLLTAGSADEELYYSSTSQEDAGFGLSQEALSMLRSRAGKSSKPRISN
jgi:hypothetical protein